MPSSAIIEDFTSEFFYDGDYHGSHPINSGYPMQLYVTIFDYDTDDTVGTGYSRLAVNFSLDGISNGIATYVNTSDLIWTNNTGSTWTVQNIYFVYGNTLGSGFEVYTYNLPAQLQKIVLAGDQYSITAGSIRIVY